jgi:hypothetical protein
MLLVMSEVFLRTISNAVAKREISRVLPGCAWSESESLLVVQGQNPFTLNQ